MKRTRYGCWLLMVLTVVVFLFFQSLSVQASQEKTDAGIAFEQSVEQENITDPIYPSKPTKSPSVNGSLPHLGQMVTSFIFLLLGLACLIVFVGVISLRKIYNIYV